MSKLKDLTGQRFGRLIAIGRADNAPNGRARWLCKCDCGAEKTILSYNLISHNTTSCGCLWRERWDEINRTELGTNQIEGWAESELKDGTMLNHLNTKVRSNNTSGTRGVSFFRPARMWRARLMLGGKEVFCEYYKNINDAIKARKSAEAQYFEPVLNKYGRTLYKED